MSTAALPAHSAWNQVHSGLAFDLLKPTAEMVKDGDVAHALAHINRFTGHLTRPYSVAQHSLLVVELLAERGHADAGVLLQGLVHDAPEYVLSDLSAPLKSLLPDYRRIEARVWAACAAHFGVPTELDPAIKGADWLACRLEAHAHMQASPGWAGTDPTRSLGERAAYMLEANLTPPALIRRWLVTLEFLRDAAAMRQTVNLRVLGERGWL